MPNYFTAVLFLLCTLMVNFSYPQAGKIVPQNNHSSGVRTAIISPDGTTCITSGFDNLLKIWDYDTGILTGNIKNLPGVVNAMNFFSGNIILTGDSKGAVSLYDIESMKLLSKRKISSRAINSVVFDKTSNMIWCSGFGGLLVGLDPDSLTTLFDMKNLPADINTATFAKETGILYLGATSGKLYLFDTRKQKITDSSEIFDSDVSGLQNFNEGKVLLASSFNGDIKFFDCNPAGIPKQNRVISTKPVSMITSLSASPSGKLAAATTLENQILLINIGEKTVYKSFKAHEYTLSLFLFKNDSEGVSFSFGFRSLFWDLNKTELEKREFNSFQGEIALFASGKDYLVYSTPDGDVFKVVLNETFKPVNIYKALSPVTALSLNNNGKKVAIGNQDGEICVINLQNGEIDLLEKIHEKEIISIKFSKDFLISSGGDRKLKIMPANALGVLSAITSELKGKFTSVGFSEELKLATAGTYEGVIYFVDPFTGKKESTFSGHTGAVNSVVTGDKGEYMVSTSDDRTTRFWNTNQLFNFRTYQNDNGIVSGAIFNTKGSVLTTGDGGLLSSIDIDKGAISQFEESDFALTGLSEFGKSHVAALSSTGLLQIWDRMNGDLEYTLFIHDGKISLLSMKDAVEFTNGDSKLLFKIAVPKNIEKGKNTVKKPLDNLKPVF